MILHADLQVGDIAAELWLNDIPVTRLVPLERHFASVPANMFVVDGENTLELVVAPGFEPAESRVNYPPVANHNDACGKLRSLAPGQFTGDDTAPVLITTEAGTELSPGRIQAKAQLGRNFGTWDWQLAPVLQLDTQTHASVADELVRIRAAFETGDSRYLSWLCRPKFEAAARAWPARPVATLLSQFASVIARYAAMPGWGMEPLDPDQFSFRLAAGARLVECINKDWKPTLRSAPLHGGYPFYFPIFLGRTAGGHWAIFL